MTILYQMIGGSLVLVGLPLTLSPIPLGIIVVAIGLSLILANSRRAQLRLRNLRARHQSLDHWLRRTERVLPGPFDRILRRTDSDGWHRLV